MQSKAVAAGALSALLLFSAPAAFAQSETGAGHGPGHTMQSGAGQAPTDGAASPGQMHSGGPAQLYMEAMEAMNGEMSSMQMTGDPDVDFALMMIPHHQSAIDMAEALLQHGDDPQMKDLAEKIIRDQQAEIEQLRAWLEANRPQ